LGGERFPLTASRMLALPGATLVARLRVSTEEDVKSPFDQQGEGIVSVLKAFRERTVKRRGCFVTLELVVLVGAMRKATGGQLTVSVQSVRQGQAVGAR